MVTATTSAPTLNVGALVKVGPAYDMETRALTRVDSVTGCEGPIVRFDGADAVIELGADIYWINVGRLSLVDLSDRKAA